MGEVIDGAGADIRLYDTFSFADGFGLDVSGDGSELSPIFSFAGNLGIFSCSLSSPCITDVDLSGSGLDAISYLRITTAGNRRTGIPGRLYAGCRRSAQFSVPFRFRSPGRSYCLAQLSVHSRPCAAVNPMDRLIARSAPFPSRFHDIYRRLSVSGLNNLICILFAGDAVNLVIPGLPRHTAVSQHGWMPASAAMRFTLFARRVNNKNDQILSYGETCPLFAYLPQY